MLNKPTYRVVVVEDDASIREMYKLKLELAGMEVYTASNGQEGLDVIQAKHPHLVLADLKMPVMSGEDMIYALRQEDWGALLKIVILTNISRSEAPMGLRLMKIDRYIVKAHSTPAQVLEIVTEVLEN